MNKHCERQKREQAPHRQVLLHQPRPEGGGGGFNRFFEEAGDAAGGPGRVLAAYEVPEPGMQDDAELAQLECIDYFWPLAQPHDLGHGEFLERLRHAPLSVLELPHDILRTPGAAPGDIAWFEISYQDGWRGGSPRGYVYRSLISPGSPISVQQLGPASPHWVANRPVDFIDWFNAEGESDARDIRRLLRQASSSSGVVVYDVGQGAWQAVLDDTGQPAVYADVGGGVLYNSRTFPRGFGTPATPPLVILSHWDWDHWSSAHRYRALLATTWLAPPVIDKPIQLAFAADVSRQGRLITWSKAWSHALKEGCLRVEKCTGATANDSGLALTVYSRPARGRNCLLPGDAAYRYIGSVTPGGERFDALCMSHHGGRLHSADYPLPKRAAIAVNSAGPRNTYKHPLFRTLSEHVARGWPMPAQTGIGGARPCHVLLPWGDKPHFCQGACDLSGTAFAAAPAPAGAFVPATATAAA